MAKLGKQIRVSLLLGSLLIHTGSLAAQHHGIESNHGVSKTADLLMFESNVGSDDVPVESGRYYNPQWRHWDEQHSAPVVESGGGLTPHAPLYVDRCFDCPDDLPWFFEGGLIALQRNRWEGGNFLTKGGTTLLEKQDLESRLEWGGRFSVGTRCWDCSELEFTGFTLPDMNLASSGRGPFNINLPVFNPPIGFEDFANDASLVDVRYETDMSGFEVLWRQWNLLGCDDPCCGTGCSRRHGCVISGGLELGLRYLNIDEQFSIYSQAGPLPAPNGLQDYRYRTSADNHILGPEVGVQFRSCPWLRFDILFTSRLALAANFVDTTASLREQSSQVAFNKSRDNVSFTQVLDTSVYLRLRPGHNIDIRAGYQLLWVNGFAGASDQFSRDLGQPGQFDDDNGVLFQGPAMLIQINF